MPTRARFEDWVRTHRPRLLACWAAIGAVAILAMVLGPEVYYLRGIAAWPRDWAILFFLSLWGWVALRFIYLWIWAWVVMAAAPLCLLVPVRHYLDAWWLLPLLSGVVVLSALSVVAAVSSELWRRRLARP
jgi:hypothetical protein